MQKYKRKKQKPTSRTTNIDRSDPYVPSSPKLRRFDFDLESVDLTPESIACFDCLLLATDYDDFDYDLIRRHAKMIVDTRGRYANVRAA